MLAFSFDAETDGLYGEAFAIGAVVMESGGQELDRFEGISLHEPIVNPWVCENVLPLVGGLTAYDTRKALREAFWQFYLKWRGKAIIVADVPYPVEAQLLRQCVQEALDERCFQGPFPLLDVASVLFACGEDPLVDRRAYGGYESPAHHPVEDARASCLCLFKALGKR